MEAFNGYDGFFRHAPALLCILDAEGGLRAVSAACEELLDLPAGGGGSLLALAHAEDVDRLGGSLEQVAVGAPAHYLRLRCKGGEYRDFRWQVRTGEGGALYGALTEREGGVHERRQFRLLVEAITDMIGTSDFTGRVTYVNPGGCAMLGYTLEEVTKCSILDLVPSHLHARYQQELIPTVMREGTWTGEVELMRKDGSVLPATQSIFILPDEHGRPEALATLAHDITTQKRLEQALREAIEELSTPMIQIWDGVLALPIIGIVDATRATRMMQSMLEAIQSKRCEIAVLDLTGVRNLDTETIGHLFRMVRAASLLGSRCVISGMSPAVAQTVAGLGLDMRDLQAFRSLQEALQLAMGSVGRGKVTRV